MFDELSKRDFLIILVALFIGIVITVEVTYYVAERYFAAQHSYDPLARAGDARRFVIQLLCNNSSSISILPTWTERKLKIAGSV
jgi:hypothetical protein